MQHLCLLSCQRRQLVFESNVFTPERIRRWAKLWQYYLDNLALCDDSLGSLPYSVLPVPSFQLDSSCFRYQQHCATDLPLSANMRFLLALSYAVSLATASKPALPLSTRQSVICQILPIAANALNGNIPCGGGSVIFSLYMLPGWYDHLLNSTANLSDWRQWWLRLQGR